MYCTFTYCVEWTVFIKGMSFRIADDTKECNFQGSDVTVPECTVPSTNKSEYVMSMYMYMQYA